MCREKQKDTGLSTAGPLGLKEHKILVVYILYLWRAYRDCLAVVGVSFSAPSPFFSGLIGGQGSISTGKSFYYETESLCAIGISHNDPHAPQDHCVIR